MTNPLACFAVQPGGVAGPLAALAAAPEIVGGGPSDAVVMSNAAYLVAGVLFILALRGLSSQETARRGNLYGIIGMVIAVAATLTRPSIEAGAFNWLAFVAIAGGAVVGATMATKVGMTSMPEMVALLHSF